MNYILRNTPSGQEWRAVNPHNFSELHILSPQDYVTNMIYTDFEEQHPPIPHHGPALPEGTVKDERDLEVIWELQTITGEWVKCLIQQPSEDDSIKTRQAFKVKDSRELKQTRLTLTDIAFAAFISGVANPSLSSEELVVFFNNWFAQFGIQQPPKVAEDKGYGSLGILSKEEAELEQVVDRIKAATTLEAIGILSEFIKHTSIYQVIDEYLESFDEMMPEMKESIKSKYSNFIDWFDSRGLQIITPSKQSTPIGTEIYPSCIKTGKCKSVCTMCYH